MTDILTLVGHMVLMYSLPSLYIPAYVWTKPYQHFFWKTIHIVNCPEETERRPKAPVKHRGDLYSLLSLFSWSRRGSALCSPCDRLWSGPKRLPQQRNAPGKKEGSAERGNVVKEWTNKNQSSVVIIKRGPVEWKTNRRARRRWIYTHCSHLRLTTVCLDQI